MDIKSHYILQKESFNTSKKKKERNPRDITCIWHTGKEWAFVDNLSYSVV
jgi:hypothetical protein